MRKSICYLAGISLLSFFIGRMLPYRWFPYDRFPFQSYPFERQGKLYLKIKINKWQSKVPDMSKLFPELMPSKNMEHSTPDMLPTMVAETCIAEVVHASLSILSLYALTFSRSWLGIGIVAAYILGNVPFILIQRYNRPRLVKLMERIKEREIHENADPEL